MSFKARPIFANQLPPDVEEAVRLMVGQLPIVFAVRNGGSIRIPAAEIDEAGKWLLDIEMDGTDFIFKASKKQ